jgi:hypothetical protein
MSNRLSRSAVGTVTLLIADGAVARSGATKDKRAD